MNTQTMPIGLIVSVCSIVVVPPISGAQDLPPATWVISQMTDTTFDRPVRVRVDRAHGKVFVADTWRKSVVILDAVTGHVTGMIGREGDGPGEFRSLSELALDADARSLAVYDLARSSIDVFTTDGTFRFRKYVRSPTFNPKDLAFASDSTWLLAGAFEGAQEMRPVHRMTARGDSVLVSSLGPAVVGHDVPDNMVTRQARGVVSGGEFATRRGRVYFAESATGHVFDLESGRRLAEGPGAVPDLVGRALVSTARSTKFWWTYPKVVLLEALSDGTFLMIWSERDNELLTFYHLANGREGRVVGRVEGIPAQDVDLGGPRTFVYVAMDSDGVSTVGRHLLPAATQRLLIR